MDWKRLREGLARARNASGLTLDELAEKTGIDRSTLHRIENTKKRIKHNPDLETIERWVTEAGLTLSAFFVQLEALEAQVATQPLKRRTQTGQDEPARDKGADHARAVSPSPRTYLLTEDQLINLGRHIGIALAHTIARPLADQQAASPDVGGSSKRAPRRRPH